MKNIKSLITVLFAIFCFTTVNAQEQRTNSAVSEIIRGEDCFQEENISTDPNYNVLDELLYGSDDNFIYRAVEQMPQFPGGDAALTRWLSNNIHYPQKAYENKIQGRVLVQIEVKKTGEIGKVKLIRSIDHELDMEAIRLAKSLPNFIPGEMDGQRVNVWYTLPIKFSIPDSEQ